MTQPLEIGVTFDYRCPFARNAHEAVLAMIEGGSRPDVHWQFHAFSLDQVHIEEGAPAMWDRDPSEWGSGVLALLYGIVVRDSYPDHFLAAHRALFGIRHDRALKLDDESVLRETLATVGLDPDAVAEEVWSGQPLKVLAQQHTEAVDRWAVFGVPTFLLGEEGVFIRFMERGRADDLDRALELLEWTRFNEFKRTRIAR